MLPGLLLSGCLTTQAQQDNAKEAYSVCITDAVRRLDDGRSDPASVGIGVAGQCSGAYAKLSQTMIGSMFTENGQAYMAGQMRDSEVKLATSAVLNYRARKNH